MAAPDPAKHYFVKTDGGMFPPIHHWIRGQMEREQRRLHRGGGSKNSLVGLNAKLLSNFNFNN